MGSPHGRPAFPVWLELVCSGCSTKAAGRFTRLRDIKRRDLWADARREGWRVDFAGGLLCRRCAAKSDRQLNSALSVEAA
jgi:hypothetical protein